MRPFYFSARKLCVSCLCVIAVCSCSSTEDRLYREAESWARLNPTILEDAGRITNVSPIGEREVECYFTDGCISHYSLEIQGENGAGKLDLVDLGRPYPASARWSWKDESIGIEGETGLPWKIYYSLPNYLEILDDRLARNDSQKSYYQRSMVSWLLGDEAQAYTDIRSAIDREPQRKQAQAQINADLYKPFIEAPRVLAVFQALDGEYSLAIDTVNSIIALHRDSSSELTTDYLLRWFIQHESGEPAIANESLMQACNLPEELVIKGLSSVETSQSIYSEVDKGGGCGNQIASSFYPGYTLYLSNQYGEADAKFQRAIEKVDDRPDRYDHEVLLAKLFIERLNAFSE